MGFGRTPLYTANPTMDVCALPYLATLVYRKLVLWPFLFDQVSVSQPHRWCHLWFPCALSGFFFKRPLKIVQQTRGSNFKNTHTHTHRRRPYTIKGATGLSVWSKALRTSGWLLHTLACGRPSRGSPQISRRVGRFGESDKPHPQIRPIAREDHSSLELLWVEVGSTECQVTLTYGIGVVTGSYGVDRACLDSSPKPLCVDRRGAGRALRACEMGFHLGVQKI